MRRVRCILWLGCFGLLAGLALQVNQLPAQEPQSEGISPESAKQLGRLLDREWRDKPEWAEMAVDILKGAPMSPVSGWFKPTETPFDGRYAIRKYDQNGDRQVDLSELGGKAFQKYFERLDRDRNGVLNRIDFDWSISNPIQQQAQTIDRIFEEWDRDANGKLTEAELVQLFRNADPEESGFLTQDDLRILFSFLQGGSSTTRPQTKPSPEESEADLATILKPADSQDSARETDMLSMLLNEELGNLTEGPDVGDLAPDFELPYLKQEGSVKLSDLRGKKLVVLNFGSFT